MSRDVERIKERLNIADVIGSYVELKKSGKNLKAKCPFHNERTPSFSVSPDRGLYYCFGCGAKGDVFTFVQEFEGLDFRGALRLLADRAGITLSEESAEKRELRDRIYDVNRAAMRFYSDQLDEHKEARSYLSERGFSDKTIDNFSLGYAPDQWRGLHDHLVQQGYATEDMAAAGVIKEAGEKNRFYDRFRDRIIFPIFDSANRVVGFSGRILTPDTEAPKYLNSPETLVFNKSQVLYGYSKAKEAIRKHDFAIFVEGQMDLLAAHQAGFRNTVATSGTSVTSHHIAKIKHMTDKVVFAFDSDEAGFTSAVKAAEIALSLEMDAKLAILPDGSDPADVITTNVQVWRTTISEAEHVIVVLLERLQAQTDDSRALRKRMTAELLPKIARIPDPLEREHFIRLTASKTSISEATLEEALARVDTDGGSVEYTENGAGDPIRSLDTQSKRIPRRIRLLRHILAILDWQRTSEAATVDYGEFRKRLERILPDGMTEDDYGDADRLVFEVEKLYSDKNEELADVLEELVVYLEYEQYKHYLRVLLSHIQEAEQDGDTDRASELLEKYQAISHKMQEIHESLHTHH